jgi:hypothetical protein
MSSKIRRSMVAMRAEAKVPAYSASANNAVAYDGDAGAVGRDGVVDWCGVEEVTEEVVTSCDTAGARSGEIRCVGETPEHHVRCPVYFAAIGVGADVAEEAVEACDGFGGGGGLLRGQGTGCGQDAGIHCPAVVQQIANGNLEFFGLAGSGWGRVVGSGGALWLGRAEGGRGVD